MDFNNMVEMATTIKRVKSFCFVCFDLEYTIDDVTNMFKLADLRNASYTHDISRETIAEYYVDYCDN